MTQPPYPNNGQQPPFQPQGQGPSPSQQGNPIDNPSKFAPRQDRPVPADGQPSAAGQGQGNAQPVPGQQGQPGHPPAVGAQGQPGHPPAPQSPSFQQPAFQQAPHGQPNPGAFGQNFGPGYPQPAYAGAVPQQKSKKKWPIAVALALVLLLALGAAFFFFLRDATAAKGEASPEAAAEALIEAINSDDLTSVAQRSAPSELTYGKEIMAAVDRSIDAGDTDTQEAADSVKDSVNDLSDSVDIEVTDHEFVTIVENDDLAILGLKSGDLKVEVTDPDTFVDALSELNKSSSVLLPALLEPIIEVSGGSASDLAGYEGDVENVIDAIDEGLKEENTFDVDLSEGYFPAYWSDPDGDEPYMYEYPLYFVMAQEGGQWYYSPMSSSILNSQQSDVLLKYENRYSGEPELADFEVPAAAEYANSEDAVRGLLTALEDSDAEAFVSSFSIPERRVLTLAQVESHMSESFNVEGLKVGDLTFSEHKRDNTTIVVIDSGEVSIEQDDFESVLTIKIEDNEVIFEYEDGYTDSTDEITFDFEESQANGVPLLGLATIKESDGWTVSPMLSLNHLAVDGVFGEDGKDILETIEKEVNRY